MCATFVGTTTWSSSLVPGSNNALNLGSTTFGAANVYSTNLRVGPIGTPGAGLIIPSQATPLAIRNAANDANNISIADGGDVTFRGNLMLSSGKNIDYAVAVPTMASTPVQGTNVFLPGLNVVPTAAANSSALLGVSATPVVGEHYIISNASGAQVRVKASGVATMNGATAGGYIVLPNLATIECFNQSVGNHVCLQPVIPTPAGP
jgi:hypothetical protein